jgi:hypothetical protein
MLHFAWKEGSRVGWSGAWTAEGITFFDTVFALNQGCRKNSNAMILTPSPAHVCDCCVLKPYGGHSGPARVYYG